MSCGLEGTNTYFASKMISEKGVLVVTDRLGSVRGDSTATNFAYFPWGKERGTTAHIGRTLFAGYYRDAVGQDYAMARYYNATTGAFWSQDPGSITTADSSNPGSWNRYAFVNGDPINLRDPSGKYQVVCSDGSDSIYDASCYLDNGYDGGGGDGGSSGNWDACGGDEFDPSPSPVCYAPAPIYVPPVSYATLLCKLTGSDTPNGGKVPSEIDTQGNIGATFADPIDLSFSVSGGNGAYQWGTVANGGVWQTVSYTGSGAYANGDPVPLGPGTYPDPLGNQEFTSNGSTASFNDLPGLWLTEGGAPNGSPLDSANITKSFDLNITITSGDGQSATCDVQWQATFALSTKKGKLQGKGKAKVLRFNGQ